MTNLENLIKVCFIEINENLLTVHLYNGEEIKLPREDYDILKLYKYISNSNNKIDNKYYLINFDDFLIKKDKNQFSFFKKILTKSYYNLKSIFNNSSFEETINEPTVVGVIDNIEIPNVNKLNHQIKYAKLINNYTGMVLFIQKLKNIINKRGHSVDDLLKFIELADLPITKDGYVLAYKVVNKYNNSSDTFVDCHSGTIKQKLGDFVYMDEKSVDKDRRVSCSNGLHIASKHYLCNFTGDTILIVKVAPEAFIAVPIDNLTKVRVSGYHIVGILSDAARNILMNGYDVSLPNEDLQLIKNIVDGNHIDIINKVFIENEDKKTTIITKIKKTVNKPKHKPIKLDKPVLVNAEDLKKDSKDKFVKIKVEIVNNKNHENAIIMDRKNGMSIKNLAKKYKHSDRTINKILKKHF